MKIKEKEIQIRCQGEREVTLWHTLPRETGDVPFPELFKPRLDAALGSPLQCLTFALGNHALGSEWERDGLRGPFQPKPSHDSKGAYGTPGAANLGTDCTDRTTGNGYQLEEGTFTLDVSKRPCPLRSGGAQQKVAHRN